MVAAGTPIRLIHENGDFTELDATSITLETIRKAGSSSIPFGGGGRYNLDLNLQNAEIMIDGIFVDDNIETAGIGASAKINCMINNSVSNFAFTVSSVWVKTNDLNNLLGSVVSSFDSDEIIASNRCLITLKDASGNPKYIPLVRVADNASGTFATVATTDDDTNITDLGTKKFIKIITNVSGNNAVRGASLAIAIQAFINAEYSSSFTTELLDETRFGETRQNVIVKITQVLGGQIGNNNTPIFTPRTGTTTSTKKPQMTIFRGGVNSIKKSAGDKVQDLYGIINNSRRTGGLRGNKDFSIRNFRMYKMNGENDGFVRPTDNSGDYIVGIQIPFNSMVNVGNETYVARNFHMPTGRNKSPENKGATAAMAVGTEFSETDKSTGIQGFVKKLSIDYDAGETVYRFKMVFLPVDWMF
jgi:hypothetical protein